jgi:DNA-directed RNA polymerase specialized sigma24 family protein
MDREATSSLRVALQQIPETYRLAIERYDLAGATAEDVALECGCSVGAMHMRRSRGLTMLRSLLRLGAMD